VSGGAYSWTGDRREFIGRNGSLAEPAGLMPGVRLSRRTGAGFDPCAAIQTPIEIKGGQEMEIVVLMGETGTPEEARELLRRYMAANLDDVFRDVTGYWKDMLEKIQVRTPDRAMNIMQNGWLLYQTIVCRVMARSAFYQASGAYGYRDQLQDTMAMALTSPEWTRQHLIRAAGRQFPEGDMQHWWLPSDRAAGLGVRTRFSDDPVWLAYCAAYYIRVTGDEAVLDEEIPFLEGPLLREEEHEAFFAPKQSDMRASLYEHCALALERAMTTGAHGLPLFGGGDWNDGMNRVGINGKGESVWLAWFIINAVKEFGPIVEKRQPERIASWRHYVDELRKSLEENAWDGEWYRRGYYDDGAPLGAASNDECRIDAIAQSWGVISGAADPDRQLRAMRSAEHYLVRPDDGLSLLFTPAFDHTAHDPGYIKGYPPGIRENGGQYTHAAIWTMMAFARLGDGDKAFMLYSMLNPVNHANSRAATYRYKVEPYVIAADIYSNPQHMGRGGWTWYTGSAGWMYRAGLESILGFQLQGSSLCIDPCIPAEWPGFEMTYRHKTATYFISVDNSSGASQGVVAIKLDGMNIDLQNGGVIPLVDDGNRHEIKVTLGTKAETPDFAPLRQLDVS
jgi:cyclic beta-1,2-glucan synthetase